LQVAIKAIESHEVTVMRGIDEDTKTRISRRPSLRDLVATRQNLLRKESGLGRNPDGTLWLREPAGTRLRQWILTRTPPSENGDGLLHAQRFNARPLSVMVTRLPDMGTSWFGGGSPSWMLLLFDPDRELSASTELVARDLGISARESEIATLLVTGYDVNIIAGRLNISVHTVRTHLKSIFSKTNIRSQAELVRRIASGPAGICSCN
jgi:DNA-binding CsgD family transcriptional regulator